VFDLHAPRVWQLYDGRVSVTAGCYATTWKLMKPIVSG
jgi:hypothetical protein